MQTDFYHGLLTAVVGPRRPPGSESVVVALDQHGVSLSSGSACKAGSPEPTHVLLAVGRTREEAHCAVRFSLSSSTSTDEVDETVAKLARVLEDMETTVRFLPCK